MFEPGMTKQQLRLRAEARDFALWVPRELLLQMDADQVHYPREYVVEAARRRLLGLRFSPEHGGRGLKWRDEIIVLEEVGVLGASLACLYFLVSIWVLKRSANGLTWR